MLARALLTPPRSVQAGDRSQPWRADRYRQVPSPFFLRISRHSSNQYTVMLHRVPRETVRTDALWYCIMITSGSACCPSGADTTSSTLRSAARDTASPRVVYHTNPSTTTTIINNLFPAQPGQKKKVYEYEYYYLLFVVDSHVLWCCHSQNV